MGGTDHHGSLKNVCKQLACDPARTSLAPLAQGLRETCRPAIHYSRRGDLWLLGKHRLLCGDARSAADYKRLLGSEKAEFVFTDPPYNVAVHGRQFACRREQVQRK